jgi:hypothetical protein
VLGCDLGTADPSSPLSPPTILELEPAASDGGVGTHPVGAPLRFRVDRLLSPRSVSRATVSVTSGPFSVYGGVRYDPVRREVQFTPNAPDLRMGLRYVFRVSTGLRAWDGAALSNAVEVPFVPGGRAMPLPRRTPGFLTEVVPLLRARCGDPRCHGGAAPTMGLDLSSPDGVARTAIGVVARETANGRNAPDYTDPRWGALLRVDPGDAAGQGRPEYSYLVYKLLGDGPVLGARMPPGAPLDPAETALLADWIAAGAPRD